MEDEEKKAFSIKHTKPIKVGRKVGNSHILTLPPDFFGKLKRSFIELLTCELQIKDGKIRIVYEEVKADEG